MFCRLSKTNYENQYTTRGKVKYSQLRTCTGVDDSYKDISYPAESLFTSI